MALLTRSPNSWRGRCIDFWKLEPISQFTLKWIKEEFKSRGYFHLKSIDKKRAITLHLRSQRGLLPYEKFSIAELTSFVSDRGLLLPSGRITLKALVTCLEEGDDNATFHGFGELPPELRLLVAEYHFKGLRFQPSHPLRNNTYQPPLTMVSRPLRHETLGAFYDVFPIRLHFRVDCSYTRQIEITLDQHTRSMIDNFSISSISHIRKFTVAVGINDSAYSFATVKCSFNLANDSHDLKADCLPYFPLVPLTETPQLRGLANNLRLAFERVVKGIASREDSKNTLCREDFKAVAEAIGRTAASTIRLRGDVNAVRDYILY